MHTSLQTVTPRLARQWLDLNSNNRPLSRAYVEELARALRSGQFRTTHQGLAFDTQGRLRDGQHRLTAIVETGIAAEMLVSTGLTETELQAIDDGRRRTAQQVLSMLNEGDVSHFTTAIARELLIGGQPKEGVKRLRPTRLDLVECFRRHQEAIAYADQNLPQQGTGIRVGYVAAVLARAFYRVDRAKLDHFAAVLAGGYGKDGDESIIRLRNHILRVRREHQRGAALRDDIYAKTEKTLKEWVEGKSSSRLTGAKEELFPLAGESEPRVLE
ncbi:MAG: hypothetical protein K1Y36_29600 [Blastocatellia bacterium]|nr:hypothetical protein [Blastocatellia bacterium]